MVCSAKFTFNIGLPKSSRSSAISLAAILLLHPLLKRPKNGADKFRVVRQTLRQAGNVTSTARRTKI